MKFGICTDINCGKWGWAPTTFDERKYFLRCDCGKPMALHYSGHPKDAGYKEKDCIVPGTYRHGEDL